MRLLLHELNRLAAMAGESKVNVAGNSCCRYCLLAVAVAASDFVAAAVAVGAVATVAAVVVVANAVAVAVVAAVPVAVNFY